ncbi:MAG: hypothetical protein JW755_12275 [Candidatus Aminicenantes bacterium]|nr:hypothetical protein [Candidatus Aminicenantes bacterium]
MKNQKNRNILILSIIAVLSLFFLLDKQFISGLISKQSDDKNLRILGSVISLIKEDYVEMPDPAKTMDGSFKGLVDSLDGYSCYLKNDMIGLFNVKRKNQLYSPGIIVYKRYGSFPVVIGLEEGSPASKMGIKIGDTISVFDGTQTLLMNMEEANLALLSHKPEPIKLKILGIREDKELEVERIKIHEDSFSYKSADKLSGVLAIHDLIHPLSSTIKKTIVPELKDQASPLVIDLRNCVAGDIEEACQFLNLFLQKDKIGYLDGRETDRDISCLDKAELEHLPLIIWMNQATMGPAEIVAGVLRKFRNTKIIGLQSPGFTAKRDLIALNDGSFLLLATWIFRFNEKESPWREGIKPDIEIEPEKQTETSYLQATQKLLSQM